MQSNQRHDYPIIFIGPVHTQVEGITQGVCASSESEGHLRILLNRHVFVLYHYLIKTVMHCFCNPKRNFEWIDLQRKKNKPETLNIQVNGGKKREIWSSTYLKS